MDLISNSPVFRRYTAIKQVVYNRNNKHYHKIGGRGIRLYWDNAYDFHQYVMKVLGPPPLGYDSKLTRIDFKRDYEPGNLKWETPYYVGSFNRARIKVRYQKQNLSLREWHKITGISYSTLYNRYCRRLSPAEILGYKKAKTKYVKTKII